MKLIFKIYVQVFKSCLLINIVKNWRKYCSLVRWRFLWHVLRWLASFLARDLAKALNMLFCTCYPKFSTFSTFYKFIIFFINLLTLYNKYGHFVLIRLDQICPKWIKLDQMCIFHLSKNVTIKSCQIYLKNNHDQLFLTRSDEICPKWIKMDQTWSNFDFSPIKKR